MKNKKLFLVSALAFVLLLAGASTLYNHLTKEIKPQGGGLSVQDYNQAANPEITENTTQQNELEKNDASTGNDRSDNEPQDPSQTKAPDFTIFDSEGNEVQFSSFLGKPVILNFWASWCGPCKMEMPDFDEKYKEFGEEIYFVMVNMTNGFRETTEIAKEFIEEQGYTFPVYFDSSSDAAITYGVTSLPTTYFINSDGFIIAQAMGAMDAATLQTGIDMITD